MKVEIIIDKEQHKFTGIKKEVINLDDNTIFPYYIKVSSIEHQPDKIVFRMIGEYQTKITHEYDKKNKKGNDKLWRLWV